MYQSPISIYETAMQTIMEQRENAIFAKVQDAFDVQVDKAELIRALQYDRDQYEKGYRDAKQEQKWIPVSERLPDNNERVLVYHDDGMIRFGINKGGFADVVSTLYLKHNHRTCFSKVTHWMPLPEPPKEE